jgi:hypothetical protein
VAPQQLAGLPVATLEMVPREARVAPGDTMTLTLIAKDETGRLVIGRAVDWTSSAPGIVAVSAAGVAIGLAPGTALVSAASEGKRATAAVTVVRAGVASLVVRPASVNITVSQSVHLNVEARDASGKLLRPPRQDWASSDQRVVTVSSSGVVTGVTPGGARVTATSAGVVSAPVVVRVTGPAPSTQTPGPTGAARPTGPQGPGSLGVGGGPGVLQMLVTPWAYVSIDGLPRGQRTRGVDTLPGGRTYRVHFEREGFTSIDTTVTLRPGDQRQLRIQMIPRNP